MWPSMWAYYKNIQITSSPSSDNDRINHFHLQFPLMLSTDHSHWMLPVGWPGDIWPTNEVSPWWDITVLSRCAVLAAGPAKRPARPPTHVTDADRRQRAKQYWPIRRASKKIFHKYIISVFGKPGQTWSTLENNAHQKNQKLYSWNLDQFHIYKLELTSSQTYLQPYLPVTIFLMVLTITVEALLIND